MKRTVESLACAFFILFAAGALPASGGTRRTPAGAPDNRSSLVDYVRPFVGTQGEGNTFPGAAAPFGMIQLSPDTDMELWETASGYEYSDSSIIGFSLTHLNGTGIPDLGDILFTPVVGMPKFIPGSKAHPDSGYRSRYSHGEEAASPGYYRVRLRNSGVTVELAAADRSGIIRLTCPATDSAFVLVDLKHVLRWDVVWSGLRVENDSTITGFHLVNGWAKERYLYFAARFSRPFDGFGIVKDGKSVLYNTYRFRSRSEATGKSIQFYAQYKTRGGEAILIKVGISATSAANALKNLDAEIPDWGFERVLRETRAKWNRELAKIEIEGTQEEKETFYTSMYHAFLAPELYEDVGGAYRGLDQNIHEARGFTNYAIFSLWDTYRATHPLFALIQPERDADMINSMLAHYDQSVEHLLPVWSLQGNETWCMIGYHAVPVIVDAYLKGVKGFDARRAYEAVRTTAMNPNYDNVATYARLGWVPFDRENESVSKTLEYAYDDYCVAQMAKSLGRRDDYDYFMKRAGSYKNIFDPAFHLMRGKDSQGRWRTPFDPHLYVEGGDITEGTSWQYTWYVPHDVQGLIALFGGKERFAAKLDSLFVASAEESKGVDDIQGRIGEYWHGNEPSHHIIFLYCYAGQPWKTQTLSHEIMRTQYGNKPNSLCGNDDCGQMSAWYIFNAMGFYPVCPASDCYVIGSPAVPKAVMHLAGGRTFTMTAENLSDRNVYVQSVRLNGRRWDKPYLPFAELKNGGSIAFTMGPEPNTGWGLDSEIPH
ncbi:MAG TPA: GH92 family glycosyl hydrolase [Candidatus Bathyarchaeia archaeon]|nr:GH92 family glycosyl hydrolase [Candidatus Bathyarchaeia archaeon]